MFCTFANFRCKHFNQQLQLLWFKLHRNSMSDANRKKIVDAHRDIKNKKLLFWTLPTSQITIATLKNRVYFRRIKRFFRFTIWHSITSSLLIYFYILRGKQKSNQLLFMINWAGNKWSLLIFMFIVELDSSSWAFCTCTSAIRRFFITLRHVIFYEFLNCSFI